MRPVQAATGAPNGPNGSNATATRAGYYSTAVPLSHGISGNRAFGSNSTGAIFFDPSGTAPTPKRPWPRAEAERSFDDPASRLT